MYITIHGVKVNVKTHFVSKINYIVTFENFEFKFTKRFFLNDVLKHYPEKINLKDFPCQLDNVTMRNQKYKSILLLQLCRFILTQILIFLFQIL